MPREIAIATMVWQDNWNLRNWVNYYSRYIPRENLFVLIHDTDPDAEEIAAGCNIIRLHRRQPYPDFDRDRWLTIQHFVNGLLHQYRVVIFNDVDEILIVDPEVASDPIEYILCNESVPVISPFGFDIVHRSADEPESILEGHSILQKRRFVRPTSIYTKPCILKHGIKFKAGGHGTDYPHLHISPNINLLHMRFVDREMCSRRLQSRRQITTDATTGKSIQSLGPETWRLEDDDIFSIFERFNTMALRVEPEFRFEAIRSDYMARFGEIYGSGMYGIRGRESRYLFELPDRYQKIF